MSNEQNKNIIFPIVINGVKQALTVVAIPKKTTVREKEPIEQTWSNGSAYFGAFSDVYGGLSFIKQTYYDTFKKVNVGYETLEIQICKYSFTNAKELVITQTQECEIIELVSIKNVRFSVEFTLLGYNQQPPEYKRLLAILNAPTELIIKSNILEGLIEKYAEQYYRVVCEGFNFITESENIVRINANFIEVKENAIYL